jgi:2-oxoisovalerate dehydrogenase E1 component
MQPTKTFFTEEQAITLYKNLLLPRRIEEKMLKLLRQNKIAKWFCGIGQEAIPVGVATAAAKHDYILTMHRNLGVFTTRDVPLYPLFCQLLGKRDGYTNGRERSFHFGIPEFRIVGMISHLAAMLPVGDGLALAAKLKKEEFVTFAFVGEGATSEGDFHEALNLAAVWKLPIVFIIENNGYGLSTPVSEQYACESLVDRAAGYGIEGEKIDGNDVIAVYEAVSRARQRALDTGMPTLIEAITFRMRGHEEASGVAYVPDHLFEEWAKKDPIDRYRAKLIEEGLLTDKDLDRIEKEIAGIFTDPLNRALKSDSPVFIEENELASVYQPISRRSHPANNGKTEELRYIDGIRNALHQAFEEDERFLILGQDIAEYGGVFKVTSGFLERYGRDRIRNTPIIESGAVGAAIGLALEGFKPVVEMQFSDFVSCGFNQIVNNLAKARYRWMPPLDVTIRMPYGGGVGAGPFHSQCPEGWFMQHPGLKVVVPATVHDAMQLLYSALLDPNPSLVFEHKKLYRSLKDNIPVKAVYEPLGKAAVRRAGDDATIVTYGIGVHWALEHAEKVSAEEGIGLEVVDLRTLIPIDMDTVAASVRKTGRVLLLQEPSRTMGPMSEIGARIAEECFEWLDAPVLRCSSLDTPVPTSRILEDGYLATARLQKQLRKLLDY